MDLDHSPRQLFGRLRMLQRSNRNFDAVGLVDRILAIVSVQRFFDRNPRLDAGSRKLASLALASRVRVHSRLSVKKMLISAEPSFS